GAIDRTRLRYECNTGTESRICRCCLAGNIDIAGRIERNAARIIVAITAEERRIVQNRIDDERLPVVVCSNFKAHDVACIETITAIDVSAIPADLLVDDRLLLDDWTEL